MTSSHLRATCLRSYHSITPWLTPAAYLRLTASDDPRALQATADYAREVRYREEAERHLLPHLSNASLSRLSLSATSLPQVRYREEAERHLLPHLSNASLSRLSLSVTSLLQVRFREEAERQARLAEEEVAKAREETQRKRLDDQRRRLEEVRALLHLSLDGALFLGLSLDLSINLVTSLFLSQSLSSSFTFYLASSPCLFLVSRTARSWTKSGGRSRP